MKKHKKSIVLSLIVIALITSVVFFRVAPRSPKISPVGISTHSDTTGNTKTTDRTTVTKQTTSAPTSEPSTSSQQGSPTTSTPQHRLSAPQPLRRSPTAPKQDQIAQTIAKQYPYKALLTANDPSLANPQVNWMYSSTNTTAAWNITSGSPVVVAVIDTGFALQHEDLASQWYQNTGEIGTTQAGDRCWTGAPQDKAANNCDDDNNGYIDDWRGWNFYGRYTPSASPCTAPGTYTSNNNPQAGSAGDDIYYAEQQTCTGSSIGDPFAAVSHGTSTAGLAGASTNNGKGVASPNWNVKLMPLQALGDDGSGWTSDVVAAIHYAVDNGASIISMSLGGSDLDPSLQSAINYAYSHNVVVVAASGNCGTGMESGCNPSAPGAMSYPALFDHVISVGATDSTDTRAGFSSYGSALDIVAPGSGSLTSTLVYRGTASPNDPATFNYTNAYAGQLYGTSFSTPIVAGIASLIRSVKPSTSVDEVTALIDGTARKVPGMSGAFYTSLYGHGIVDANTLVAVAQALSTSSDIPNLAQTGDHRSEHSFNTGEPILSGCRVSALGYCTLRAHNSLTGADRFLPYAQADASGNTGWSWPGAALATGEWTLHAVQGTNSSTDYYLFSK